MKILLVAIVAFLAVAGGVIWNYQRYVDRVYDRAAITAFKRLCSPDGDRVFVPLAEVPENLRQAFFAAQQPDRYGRATTVTVLAHCLMETAPYCCTMLDWHIENVLLANRIRRDLKKDKILEIYLNEVWMGRNAYGVGAAAEAYFGKALSGLNIEEAATLAALPKAPSYLGKNADRLLKERNAVLERMSKNGSISSEQARSAVELPLRLRELPI